MIEEKNKILGLAGEVFVESYCRQNKIKYKKGTNSEDVKYGIDAYIDGCPTDIKNTNSLYICQIYDTGIINVRHPFKKDSKPTHYCFVNVDGAGQGKFIEHISIKEKLLRDIVKSEEDLTNLLVYLHSLDNALYQSFGINLNQAALTIKNEILKYCKPSITLTYEEPQANTQLNFKISIKEKVINKPTIQSLSAIRDKIRNNTTTPIKKKENNIITINI